MSKVIVEMEMPTGCANCPMGDDDSRFCKAAKEYIPMLGKPSWCPIVGVLPEEHGDLIDRDRLEYRVMAETNPFGKPTIEYESGIKVMQMIEDAFTVIQAERKDYADN